jgi:hypothetical protein
MGVLLEVLDDFIMMFEEGFDDIDELMAFSLGFWAPRITRLRNKAFSHPSPKLGRGAPRIFNTSSSRPDMSICWANG